jgi:SAM-dependent methyltransferase
LPRLRVVDLGCGNAYLTFAAYQYLTGHGYDVTMIGVDQREDQRRRNRDLAATLGWADRVQFVAASIAQAPIDGADLVLALHACDTATDEALTRAIGWQARYVLAAPCCHHDLAAQLKHATVPQPYQIVTKHPILRERLAEILTDALRANLVRQHGYHVDVVEFIESRHTGRNLLLRAAWTGTPATAAQEAEFIALTSTWGIRPRLADLLGA